MYIRDLGKSSVGYQSSLNLEDITDSQLAKALSSEYARQVYAGNLENRATDYQASLNLEDTSDYSRLAEALSREYVRQVSAMASFGAFGEGSASFIPGKSSSIDSSDEEIPGTNLTPAGVGSIVEPSSKKPVRNADVAIKIRSADLKNGLPIWGKPGSIVDKTDDDGKVLQRRIYGADGRAVIDFDTTDHNFPSAHPTGAHKHILNYLKKNPHGNPLPLTEQDLIDNSDIIQRGVNYHDPQ